MLQTKKHNYLLLDIESYPNFFCVGIRDYETDHLIYYEISEERNDFDEIVYFLRSYDQFLITFNGLHYDEKVLKYLLAHNEELRTKPWYQITLDLKYASDDFIQNEYSRLNDTIKYVETKWISVDLFCYWAKMTRISKKISLKSLGIQLGYPIVQELPYHHESYLNSADLKNLRVYNTEHDLGILKLLFKSQQGEFEVRKMIYETYGIECFSLDATKIASKVLSNAYCEIKKLKPYYVEKQRFIKPNIINFKDILVGFNPTFKIKAFQDLWKDVYNSKNTFSKKIHVQEKNTSLSISYGIGGIHAINENEKYYSSETHIIKTSDIASLYPNLIINFGCIRFPEVLKKYTDVKAERLIAKANKEKVKDKFLKLVLNNVSGLLDLEYSWLYFPEGALRMRMIGQLFLTLAMDRCIEKGWQVISVNTKIVGVLKLG